MTSAICSGKYEEVKSSFVVAAQCRWASKQAVLCGEIPHKTAQGHRDKRGG
ncbi:hypothetical protein M2125_002091 [Polynucleobacter sphagniphilus]|uniref:Uncharacterized protein n=1 Tax=Polynucleobacter sphagniphilus TaxID=1743169 RepID=A0AA43S4N5_9BURK|nr:MULTISPECIES: hypothetical protein [Polynucleobacter]MEA9566913.1 hypothetical protein [Polynucleobacter sp. AP-Nickl1-40-C4]MBU3619902.1 hypothetical protein [Polynucleobacter sp. JS-Fieb-80-E5]MDH6242271.1 hypothetical protein [Polynucleobacter sphagniphilus]MDH6503530.1 hypothetical protein [Polynucleobacter sphagniphilus]MDH6512289.1 hypothetical protein [Polynucleobacter sphagniphilus]